MSQLLSSVNSDYRNDIHSWLEIEAQVRNIAEAGFTHTQWIHDWQGEYIYSPSEMLQTRDLLRHYGVKAHTIHATEGGVRSTKVNGVSVPDIRRRFTNIRKDYTSPNEYCRLAGVDLLKNRIDLCSHIGAGAMVLHMQLPFDMLRESASDKEDYYRQVCKSFDEIREYAKAAGVRIALENLLFTPMELEEEKFDRMFDRYDDDFMAFCYDSGHASVMCPGNFYHFLEKYHTRLYATHLQDTDSLDPALLDNDIEVLKADAHRVPFSGVVDWDKVAYWVARAPLDLPADFEVVLAADSEEEDRAQLLDCRERAERFYEMVLRHRQQ